ncbi:related to cysteine-rich protein NFX-1 [Fusarium proliferatum]|nr:related to cysteine-rich protein NFX-1 [Fusarium proliferatum]
MAEQETSRTSHQARNNAPNRSQSEGQGSASRSRGGSGGGRRRGRGGRNRGQRQDDSAQVPEGRGNAPQTGPADATIATPTIAAPESSGSSRGRRNRRGNRGGSREQGNQGRGVFSMGPQRTFGGRLTTTEQPTEIAQDASLSADAPEFVPGQPVSQRSAQQHPSSAPQPTGQGRLRNRTRNRKQDRPRQEVPKSTASELWQRIQEDIANWNYECRICTEEVTRKTEVWSCTTCWTVVHLECAHQWWDTSMKVNEESGDKSWRCPGCNSTLIEGPGDSSCWCGKETQPSRNSILPPHSCGQTCSKPRSTCSHPCTLQCHPGPCPPCTVLSPPEPCYCGKHSQRKNCRDTDYHNGWSCRERCGDFLPCGQHECPQTCHPGVCGTCEVPVEAKCYCGRVQKEMLCSKQEDICDSFDLASNSWFEGSFSCESACGRTFDCGVHRCQISCHSQEEVSAHCPFSPDVVTHCPCGKTPLKELMEEPRQTCENNVPHCERVCEKKQECGHLCQSLCHTGECDPCTQTMEIDCRCGRVTGETICHEGNVQHPLCFKICQATRNCGRHRCGEHCCPGEKKASQRIAQQKKQRLGPDLLPVEAEHICVAVCGRPLKCGSHFCEQLCHRGACQSCPEAIWEEVSCNCGQTVLHPPQPCGTRQPSCTNQCQRQTACGHPSVDHQCHPDDVSCPPCTYLVQKRCICGKTTFHNKPCHLQEAHCGEQCGQKLSCGLHTCKKLCHRPGECGDAQNGCEQICGKPKLLCNHPCQIVCHGQTPCKESTACQVKMSTSCACGNHKQSFKCLASTSNPTPSRPDIRCDEECERLDRNRRLAAALNIDPASHTNDHIPFSDNTLKLYKQMPSWGDAQESQFRVFAANKDEVRLRYEPMKNQSRQFLHLLAEDFGFESKSEDYDIHRSVLVWKSDKFVSAPTKTLAQCVKIRATQAAEAAAAAAIRPPSPPILETEPFNALVLTEPRFGLTIEEVNAALEPDLTPMQGFRFKVDFLNEEVLIKASVSYSAFLTPAPMEKSLEILKPRIEQTIRREKLAESVLLCHSDANGAISRREVTLRAGTGGWSAVAGRAASRPMSSSSTPAPEEAKPGRKLLLGLKKKRPQQPEGGKVWAALDGDVEC